VTWGDPDSGGASSGVKDQLKGVPQVEGTERGYVAILADTSVVTWGDPRFCRHSSAIQAQVAYL
jgi:hypothetical protein